MSIIEKARIIIISFTLKEMIQNLFIKLFCNKARDTMKFLEMRGTKGHHFYLN